MRKFGFARTVSAATVALVLMSAGTASAAFEGFGSDIPLESAARQITPDNWKIDYADNVDKTTAVSWTSASDWQSALSAAVGKAGYSAQFGSDTVVISKAAASAPRPAAAKPTTAARPYSSTPASRPKAQKAPAPRPAPAAKPARVQEAPMQGGGGFVIRPYRGASPAPQVAPSGRLATKGDFEPYKPTTAPRQSFAVSEGQMLHTVLTDWADKAGWRVVWESEFDYRIESSATFSGDFIAAASGLAEAMSDARPAITIDFFKGNNVVVVSNKSSDEVN